MASTQGLKMLEAAGVLVSLHPYDYDPNADAVGMAAARALGLEAGVTLKTLMVEVDGNAACCVIPSDRTLSMKKVAAAFGGKHAEMMQPAKAEKVTGYKVGGISPFGQRKVVPTVIEASVGSAERVWINAGQRGLLLGISPGDALAVLGAKAVEVTAG